MAKLINFSDSRAGLYIVLFLFRSLNQQVTRILSSWRLYFTVAAALFLFRAFTGQGHESLDDTLDDEIVEFLLVTAQTDRMQSSGYDAVAVVGRLAMTEIVASADCLDLSGHCSPYRVILQHTHILLHLTAYGLWHCVLVQRWEEIRLLA